MRSKPVVAGVVAVVCVMAVTAPVAATTPSKRPLSTGTEGGGTLAPAVFGSHGRAATRCGGRMSVLVWPHGHGVVQSVNFPAIVNPHVEVYVGWSPKYPESLYAGYVVGGTPKGSIPVGDVNLHLNCINYGTTAKPTAMVAGGVKVSTQTALRCTFAGSGVFDLIERGAGARVLILHNGPKVLLRADASRTSASVTVPKGACKRAAVPS